MLYLHPDTDKKRLMKLKVVLMEEADAFMYSLPRKAYQKVVYNLHKVENGILDKELLKKLENTEIWELRTLFNGLQYRLFAFFGHGRVCACHCHTRHCQENAENAGQRDSKGGKDTERIFLSQKTKIRRWHR